MAQFGHDAVVDALRQEAAAWRARLATGTDDPSTDALAASIERDATSALARSVAPSLRPVINATGVIIHTNLGRAPLAAPAIEQLRTLGAGYSNLEYRPGRPVRAARVPHTQRPCCAA